MILFLKGTSAVNWVIIIFRSYIKLDILQLISSEDFPDKTETDFPFVRWLIRPVTFHNLKYFFSFLLELYWFRFILTKLTWNFPAKITGTSSDNIRYYQRFLRIKFELDNFGFYWYWPATRNRGKSCSTPRGEGNKVCRPYSFPW